MKTRVLLVVVSLMLTGCGKSGSLSDLRTFIQKEKNKPKDSIEPLPKFISYKSFIYAASDLRSPFKLPIRHIKKEEVEVRQVFPDLNRVKQFLEKFSLNDLKMVGFMEKKGKAYALIQTNKKIYQVKVGDYLGKNSGKIIVIKETTIRLKEIFPNGQNTWIERDKLIKLKGN